MEIQREAADFIKKQRATIGFAEFALCAVRAVFHAEEKRFSLALGQSRAIDRQERFASPIRRALDGAGKKMFADTRFAFNQHWQMSAGCALTEPDGAGHVFAARENMAETDGARFAARGAAHFILQSREAQNIFDRDLQALATHWLDDKVASTRTHGAGDEAHRIGLHLHDGRHTQTRFPHAGLQAHAIHIGENNIENQQRDRRFTRTGEPGERSRARLHRLGLVAKTAQHGLEQATLHGIGISNQNRRRHGFSLGGACGPRDDKVNEQGKHVINGCAGAGLCGRARLIGGP